MADAVAVRYCGGCNPRYERGTFVSSLARQFPDLEFVPYPTPQANLVAVLVVCGCTAACASQHDLPNDLPRFLIFSANQQEMAADFLHGLNKES